MKDGHIGMDTYYRWWVVGKVVGGEACEVKVRDLGAKFTRRCFFNSDMLKLCMRQNQDINKLFPDMIVFLDENNPHYELMG